MADRLQPGTSFAGYRIVRVLGRGRDGATYLAASPGGTEVVLRVLPRAGMPEAARALLAEQERVARFQHPLVARVLDAGVVDDVFYVAREYVAGVPLDVEEARREWPERRWLLPLLADTARIVDAAHERGLVHGNLRPSNLLVADGRRIYVVDFGAGVSTRPPRSLAHPELAEVWEGEAPTAASDVYALARTAFWTMPNLPLARYRLREVLTGPPESRAPMGALADRLDALARRYGAPPPQSSFELPPFVHPHEPWSGEEPSVAESRTEDLRDLREQGPYLEHSAPARRARRPPPKTVVNTGFERRDRPGRRIARTTLLRPDTDYAFTLDIGWPDPASIETTPTELPADLPAGARLTVTVHPVSGDVGIDTDRRMGALVLREDGTAAVVQAPAGPDDDVPSASDDRLRFPMRTGAAGTIRLRASILYGATVIQSRLVRAVVGLPSRTPGRGRVRQTTKLDYTIAKRLTGETVARFQDAADVSLMLNGDADTHALQVVARTGDGDSLVTHGATFDGSMLQSSVEFVRAALRTIAWGKDEPWCKGDDYRYGEPAAPAARLNPDLCRLAIKGYRLYNDCINPLAGVLGETADALERTLRPPLRVQLASRRDARLLLPIALFYDTPLDTSIPLSELTVCDAYRSPSVAESRCLRGECPHYGDDGVVCPSGFWGFRHVIGLPLSLAPAPGAAEVSAATEIAHDSTGPAVTMAVSTDPDLKLRAHHETAVKALVAGGRWRYADDLASTIRLLKATDNQLFYFYCHGGIDGGTSYLQVGPATERGMTSDMVRSKRIRWREPSRPLVFINGCHTTAVEPGQLFNFVSALVETASAAGVVGTEITTFEPLAGAFATGCLSRFLAGEALGEAIRGARLDLLQENNPLGLIYTPFAMPSLRLITTAAPPLATSPPPRSIPAPSPTRRRASGRTGRRTGWPPFADDD